MRLRYGGSASTWGFALYLASTDEYQDAILPTSGFVGTPENAFDCACGLYLTDPSIRPAPHTTVRSISSSRATGTMNTGNEKVL
ncbi:hypothetical protein [Streptomyces sp. NPDC058545]|uniref:hypothetical protein n=1 Tax=Streptomyces sp. NPDC058545 TaxID=3346544 RepID=UPI003646CD89